MRTEVNSNPFEISNRFEKSFSLYRNFTVSNLESSNPFKKLSRLHGDFTEATFQTITRLWRVFDILIELIYRWVILSIDRLY